MSWYSDIIEADRLTKRFYAVKPLRDKPAAFRDAYLRKTRLLKFHANLAEMTRPPEDALTKLQRVASILGPLAPTA